MRKRNSQHVSGPEILPHWFRGNTLLLLADTHTVYLVPRDRPLGKTRSTQRDERTFLPSQEYLPRLCQEAHPQEHNFQLCFNRTVFAAQISCISVLSNFVNKMSSSSYPCFFSIIKAPLGGRFFPDPVYWVVGVSLELVLSVGFL